MRCECGSSNVIEDRGACLRCLEGCETALTYINTSWRSSVVLNDYPPEAAYFTDQTMEWLEFVDHWKRAIHSVITHHYEAVVTGTVPRLKLPAICPVLDADSLDADSKSKAIPVTGTSVLAISWKSWEVYRKALQIASGQDWKA